MTHEFKEIIIEFELAKANGLKSVLASLVFLEGSSYRKPGVRMLLIENDKMVGALSGGCVEKEIQRQVKSVFSSGKPKLMIYDGRYRLGCEGQLYILIEPFNPSINIVNEFNLAIEQRIDFKIKSNFCLSEGTQENSGSQIVFKNDNWSPLNQDSKVSFIEDKTFNQLFKPCFRLVIIGAEHDAVQLNNLGVFLGWEVVIIANSANQQTLKDFPGAKELIQTEPNLLKLTWVNKETALVFMTHSFARDLQYLVALKDTDPSYIGLLGPKNRREKILNDFIELHPLVEEAFLDKIYGPAGLNIGSKTAQEIAVSICSEILSVTRGKAPDFLKNKKNSIHNEL
ncbi:XdhC family protein [Lutibacter citreus]|uniref:XdhC family protein n=1 Tax=Lutibacter citreus TaxID=2138210 RepID=UPI000DBE4CAA|nr:XdhC/CoxI family protein [Lutibacter citreus]